MEYFIVLTPHSPDRKQRNSHKFTYLSRCKQTIKAKGKLCARWVDIGIIPINSAILQTARWPRAPIKSSNCNFQWEWES